MNTQKIIEKEWAISKLTAYKNDAERKQHAEIAKNKAMIDLFRDTIQYCRRDLRKGVKSICIEDDGYSGIIGVMLTEKHNINT